MTPKYLTNYGNADWYNNPEYYNEYYSQTNATVTQLKKLSVPTTKAFLGFNNNYKGYYTPILVNIISKEDLATVDGHLAAIEAKAELKKQKQNEILKALNTPVKTDTSYSPTLFDLEDDTCFCPCCESSFDRSYYLSTAFDDTKTEWLANLVTHYRHSHTDWDEIWPVTSRRQYDVRKESLNTKIKSAILKNAKDFLIANGITAQHFNNLDGYLNTDTKVKLIKALSIEGAI